MGTKNPLSSAAVKTFPPPLAMAPTGNSKWVVLRELALARFPEDAEVADAMRRAEELAVQQPNDPAAFVAATEALVQAGEEKRIGDALVVVNQRKHSVVGSRQAEQEAWVLAAAVAAYQQKEVVEVAEDAAHQASALLHSQSVDIATVESTAGPFFGNVPHRRRSRRVSERRGHGRGLRGGHGGASGAARRGGRRKRRH
jgi:hypothetical protein